MSRTRAVRAAAVLTALASTLLVAGCGGDPEPKFAAPSETTSAPTPTPSETPAAAGPTEPTLPPAAEAFDGAAAIAFVEYFWRMVNYAQASGDMSGLERISDESCRACQGGLDFLRKVARRNGVIRGGTNEVVQAKSLGYSKYKGVYRDATVEFTLRSSKQVVTYPNERDPETYSGGEREMTAIARKLDGEWSMIFWGPR